MAGDAQKQLEELRKDYSALKEEFDEFRETSKELEQESEVTLKQTEEQLKASQARLAAETKEKQSLLDRLAKSTQAVAEIDRLNQELEKQKAVASDLRAKIATLETENEEFCQREREASAQNDFLQQRLDEELERYAPSLWSCSAFDDNPSGWQSGSVSRRT
jgi:hypothetical protein